MCWKCFIDLVQGRYREEPQTRYGEPGGRLFGQRQDRGVRSKSNYLLRALKAVQDKNSSA